MSNQPYSTKFKSIEEMKAAVGKEIGLTDWAEITQERINQFATVTEDEQWIHVDVEKAKKYSPYKAPIAHGFLVLSLASKFAFEAFEIDNIKMGVNYGLDKVRFINATPVGAHLRARVVMMECIDKPGGARYKILMTFELKGQEKPACVAEWIGQIYV